MNKLQTIEWFSEEDEDKDGILPNMKHMCFPVILRGGDRGL
jgi:hypothetical protein